MTKRAAQAAHARRRFRERHDLDITDRDLTVLVTEIQAGRATLVERQSNRVSVWDVPFEGRVRRVVYDRHRKTLVTVLP